jgi:hypothetical protein
MRALAVGAALVFTAVCHGAGNMPAPTLVGVPLTGATGLQLLVADNPPFVLDVDSGQIQGVQGLDMRGKPGLSVFAVGEDGIVSLRRRSTPGIVELYVVRARTTTATRLASTYQAASSADGHGLWLLSHKNASHCTLREVGLDGRELRAPRAAACAALLSAGPAGLIYRTTKRDTLVDPLSGRSIVRAPGIVGVAAGTVVTTNASHGITAPLVATVLRSGKHTQIHWPSELSWFDPSLAHPSGQFMAIPFVDPAYPGPAQALDVWLFDPGTNSMKELPDMPAEWSLKGSDEQWAADGRLVFLGETGDHEVVGIWRPGDEHIAVREIQIPDRTSGSDSFVAWN